MALESGTKPTPIIPFEVAWQAYLAQPENERRFLSTTPIRYESVKDTVPQGERGSVCVVCHSPRNIPGFVRLNFKPGHPMFGKAFPCPACNTKVRT